MMTTSLTTILADPLGGFLPSQTLVQTSLTTASLVAGLTANVSLPDNTLPGGAPSGYAQSDVLVIENLSNGGIEWSPWPQGANIPPFWSGTVLPFGKSLRLIPSPLSATGQALLIRCTSTGAVNVRRGYAVNLSA